MPVQDYTEPNVCIDENLSTDPSGLLVIQPWAVVRPVADVKAVSSGDGTLFETSALPGKLLIDQQVSWRNNTPVEHMICIRVVRGPKSWITSNPNAIQFRDRWSWHHDVVGTIPDMPVVTGIYNSQCGSALDCGTNSVAEPNPGLEYMWMDVNISDEWVGPIEPGEKIIVWYRMYVWTPPPFSDNANKNAPMHVANGNWARIQLVAHPQPGNLVVGSEFQ